ncbi:hypothetical protein PHO31112_01643 [Pandoraea horticolens]|uniref:Uncharacterized protein n=1 Tax=Pandoraea horticolens TaxID=2508298 RepID=A0A5E4TY02_9BURK|nr:hypothetical protein [Pandoraea horticolens]VVD91454.1 hypothetical protein PHO31112_01643 [Pandoraea horticolens]
MKKSELAIAEPSLAPSHGSTIGDFSMFRGGEIQPNDARCVVTQDQLKAAVAADEARLRDTAVSACRGMLAEATESVERYAESHGKTVKAFGWVWEDDGSTGWEIELASMLCECPEHCRLNNAELAILVAKRMGLPAPLSSKRFSKPMSQKSITEVQRILAEHGKDGSTVAAATDIKRALTRTKRESPTEFLAAGCKLDGRLYKYRRRERAATGKPHNDLCIRIAGADVPLIAVLALRGISIGQFIAADAKALSQCAPEDLAERESSVRPARIAKSLRELQECVRQTAADHLALRTRTAEILSRNPFLPEGAAMASAFIQSRRP